MKEIIGPVRFELEQFEKSFRDLLHSNIPLAEQVVQHIARHKGKRLRPVLVFLVGKLYGPVTEKSMASGIVVELLHTATLVHDDVVDDSDLRRGSPTVNSRWTNKISILVGDLLFARTLTAMVDLKDFEALEILSEATKQITEGELLQIERAQDFEMEESVYFDLIYKKTASLFRASCELGVLSVTTDEEMRENMRVFGENLGIAFQIKDDLLDYIGEQDKIGKPTGNDIKENKITLPLIYALSKSTPQDRNRILRKLEKGSLLDHEVVEIVDYVNKMGGVNYASSIANKYALKALKVLEHYPQSSITSSLRDLVEFAIYREN